MSTTDVQIIQTGAVALPAKIRSRYKLEEGDVLTLIDLDGGLLLFPKRSVVSALAKEMEKQREEAGMTIDELLKGLDEQRLQFGKN